MSLSFQMTRGLIALPLLVALAVVALLAPEPSPAQAGAHDIVIVHLSGVCPLPPPALRLAMTPVDLGALARRMDTACRA